MAFYLGDILVDRIQYGVFENSDSEVKYLFTNLNEATIDISADEVEAVDGTGSVIRTFYRGKTGTLTATNSVLNAAIIAAQTGSDEEYASSSNAITMPYIGTITTGSTLTMTGYTVDSSSTAGADVSVYGVVNGTLGDQFTLGTTASETEFAVALNDDSVYVLTPPTDTTVDSYFVKYDREVTEGAKLVNTTDTFPSTGTFTLKLIIADPCSDSVSSAYMKFKFQPDPNQSFSVSDASQTIDLSGKMLVDYCGSDKVLYEMFFPNDEEE